MREPYEVSALTEYPPLTDVTGTTLTSDRNAKANIVEVEGREILERLDRLPISSWNYRAESNSIRHIGPMAQDFRAAFGLGKSDRSIQGVDAHGVALAAVQALYQMVKQKDQQIAGQQAQIAALEARLAAIEAANQH
jgi:Chaperone of endosialidase